VSAWAPTYFHEGLGVPLASLGAYTSLPMMLGMWFRGAISGGETALLAKGYDQLALRIISHRSRWVACVLAVTRPFQTSPSSSRVYLLREHVCIECRPRINVENVGMTIHTYFPG
jgi:hypothetical protein